MSLTNLRKNILVPPMRIATFNINGVKARINAVTEWLQDSAPDVALLQEIKSIDDNFPRERYEEDFIEILSDENRKEREAVLARVGSS